jgi:F0F1-type ATP synthase assembly protein I
MIKNIKKLNKQKKNEEKETNSYISEGLVFGMIGGMNIGIIIGKVNNNVSMGLIAGMLIGLSFGIVIGSNIAKE